MNITELMHQHGQMTCKFSGIKDKNIIIYENEKFILKGKINYRTILNLEESIISFEMEVDDFSFQIKKI